MVLQADFQNILQYFVYSNLPILMNPSNANHLIVTNTIIPTSPTADTTPVIVVTPDVLEAIKSYTINNFPDIGLPKDIQEIANNFFANLSPLISLTPTTAVAST